MRLLLTTKSKPNLRTGWSFRLLADDIGGQDGSPVRVWPGDGITMTPVGTAPTLVSRGVGPHTHGRPVQFSTSSTPLAGAVSVGSTATYHLVVYPSQAQGSGQWIDGYGAAGSGRHALFSGFRLYQGSGFTNPVDTYFEQPTPTVVTAVFGPSKQVRVNGLQVVSSSDSGSNTLSNLLLGADAGLGTAFQGGRIGCVVAYSGVLSDADIAANEFALGTYYGVKFTNQQYYRQTSISGMWLLKSTWIPDSQPAPLCIYHHGAGENSSSVFISSDKAGVVAALMAAGYRVVGIDSDGANWGNAAAMANYVAGRAALVSAGVNITKTVFLSQSMGGLTGLSCLADSANWSDVVGWYGIYPVCSLSNMFANNTGFYAGQIRAAYGIASDGSDYSTKTSGYDPLLLTASVFSGKRLRFTASYDDTVVSRTGNSDAMSSHVASTATEYSVVSHTGQHGDKTAFLPQDVLAFFERC